MKTYTFASIHCNDCGERLEKKLQKIKGAENAHIDYDHSKIHIPDEADFIEINKIFAQEKIMAFPLDEKEETPHEENVSHKHGSHSHTHSHDHSHGKAVDFRSRDQAVKNIKVVFFINILFSIIEVIFGLLFNSVAILADAVHDFGDAVSVGLAWFFQQYSTKEANTEFSFGHQRFSLLGALITAIVLLVGSVVVLTQSIPRIFNPEEVNAEGMFFLAIFAIILNGYAAYRLSKGTSKNESVLNLHMLEDVLGWVGVLIMSVVVRFTDWYILDPIFSVAISIFIFVRTLPIFISTVKIFLEGVPEGVDIDELQNNILNIDEVHAVSHLHVWTIDGEENAMTVTIFVSTEDPYRIEEIKNQIRLLTKGLNISHSTIEITLDKSKSIVQDSFH